MIAARMTPTPPQPGFPRSEAAFAFCASLFVVTLVLTNVIGTKLFVVPEWIPFFQGETLTSGILTYPLTFLLTDLVSEIWGRQRAKTMVVWGFLMSLMMLGVLGLAVGLAPSNFWTQPDYGFNSAIMMQLAFEATFANPAVLLGASMLAYLVAQLFDVRLYHFWWQKTKGRHMWLRNNGSTFISQLVDTIIVNGIFLRWGLDMEWDEIGRIILVVYLFKLCLAVIDTPLIYGARAGMHRFLGIAHDPDRATAPLA
jgi:queuosine precursor transporter